MCNRVLNKYWRDGTVSLLANYFSPLQIADRRIERIWRLVHILEHVKLKLSAEHCRRLAVRFESSSSRSRRAVITAARVSGIGSFRSRVARQRPSSRITNLESSSDRTDLFDEKRITFRLFHDERADLLRQILNLQQISD